MTYATSNPPKLLAQAPGGGPQMWIYVDEDAHGDVDADDYFSNALELGMKANDVIIIVDIGATCTIHTVTAVDADGATVAAATLA